MKRFSILFLFMLLILYGCAGSTVKPAETILLTINRPEAEKVRFFSSLDGFKARAVRQNTLGNWQVVLPSDQPFAYFFQVDGLPALPNCLFREFDDFGTQHCLHVPVYEE